MKTFSKTPGNERSHLIVCPLCGEPHFKKIWPEPSPFVQCRRCACVYQNPQPFAEDLVGRYDSEYLEYELENESRFFQLMLKGLDDADFASIEKTTGAGAHFLDVGCATGMLLDHMEKRGWRVSGVEVCGPAARYGIDKRGLDIHIGTMESACFPDASFDVVHCSHLVEHLVDPRGYVENVFRTLKDDGWFIVTTPNISGLQARVFGCRWRSAIDDHMVLFSRKNLMDLLEQTGFTPVCGKTWGGLATGAGFQLLKPLLDRCAKRFGFGDVMIIAARKQ